MNKISSKEFQKIFKESGGILNSKGRPIISPHLLDKGTKKVPAQAENRRVKNATKVFDSEGKKIADSKWELKCKVAMEQAGLKFEFQKKFLLLPTMRRKGLKRALSKKSWTADFVFEDLKIVADAKGFMTDVAPITIKLFCFRYPEYDIYILNNKTDLYNFINEIKKMYDRS